jgi:hypothetical protein
VENTRSTADPCAGGQSTNRRLRTILSAIACALALLAFAPAGALADGASTLSILSPAEGQLTSSTPSFSGTTNGTENPVTLVIYQGATASGTPIAEIPVLSLLGDEWDALAGPLAEGTYTAVATEAEEPLGSPLPSAPVTFTVEGAPTVTAEPTDETVTAGEAATFTASARGTPTPEVQWQVSSSGGASWSEDTSDNGANTDTLVVSPTNVSEDGLEYRAVFTNSAGEAASEPAHLEVQTAPVITANPLSRAVVAGESASFHASAEALPAASVQWQVLKNGASAWANDTVDEGTKSETLTIAKTSEAQNANEYRAVFTNPAGSATSAPASLEVRVAPVVTHNPSNQVVVAGQAATFTAEAKGQPTPEVQWQVSSDEGASWSDDVSDGGAGTTKLEVSPTNVGENGYEYRAVFANSAGEATSGAARLEVQTTPVVTSNPVSQAVVVGESASFHASAEAMPAASVQWQVSKNGGASWASDTADEGAQTETLTIAATTLAQNTNQYRAVFTNHAGSVTSAAASLEVRFAPVLTQSPSNQGVTAGESVSFTAKASGRPTPTVQWEVSTDFGKSWAPDATDAGAKSETLTIASATEGQNGYEYRAVFTNIVGSVTTAAATLTVRERKIAPVVTHNPESEVAVVAGETAVFTASASGKPAPEVEWQVSTDHGKHWNPDGDPGASTQRLEVRKAQLAQSGNEYRAVFTNVAGEATSTASTLTVSVRPEAPNVTISPASQTVVAGHGASFTAAATGVPTPTVEWQVSTDSGAHWSNAGEGETSTEKGLTTSTLAIAAVSAAQDGDEYRAVFSNGTPPRAVTAQAHLSVETPPAITIDPISTAVTAGETASFSAAASGDPAPTVQWQESGDGGASWSPVPGAVGGTLTLAATTVAQSGREYRAVFTNVVASTASAPATLTVLAPPVPPAAAPPPPPAPSASFTWAPASPHPGESITLASTSTDSASAITAFAWDVLGNGVFAPGSSAITTSFATAGGHPVSLSVTDANGQSSVVTETIPVSPPPMILLQPFPIVRIAGTDGAYGARLSLLTVQAPVGATVSVTCRGHGCPPKAEVHVAASKGAHGGVVLVSFRRFERTLAAGVMLQIRVFKSGSIGKYTSFTIRRSKLPIRVDACLNSAGGKPFACPS